jgi:ABC-type glycerol-3-phosphate transport system permease component
MSIIGKVGQKSLKVKTLNTAIHLVLLLGAVTMIYPFLLMISSSVKSAADSYKMSILPEYLFKDEVLFQKYLEARYNEESIRLADNYAGRYASFREVRLPVRPNPAIYELWKRFLEEKGDEFGVYDYYVSEQYGRGVYPRNQRLIRGTLRKENDNDLTAFNNKYGLGVQSWEQIVIEEKDIITRNYHSSSEGYLGRYERFKQQIPFWHRNYINVDGNFAVAELIPAYHGDLRAFNRDMGTRYASWSDVVLPETVPPAGSKLRPFWIRYVQTYLNINHVEIPPEKVQNALSRIPEEQRSKQSGSDKTYIVENLANPEDLSVRSINLSFRKWLLGSSWGPPGVSPRGPQVVPTWQECKLPESYPQDNIFLQDDWLEFARSTAREMLILKPSSQTDYIAFLKRSYQLPDGTVDVNAVNRDFGTGFDSELNIYPSRKMPSQPAYREAWITFLQEVGPIHLALEVTPELERTWQEALQKKYQTLDGLNEGWGLVYDSYDEFPLPVEQIEYFTMLEHKNEIKWEFVKRNYAMVLDQMFNDARSLRNTLIYCLLSILVAITVNPLAAYALSRFKPKLTYQMIMLFMLTMAFPAMVMGIPNFLMLKRLNMLNTFWALILPAAADGYFIFLLKGFFDSLPKELYESARLDGAGEFRMFWQFTLYLSKPILAVIALSAFNAAYRNFLFAFIVCQDQSMWTLMVHIYQLMQRASQNVGYAALVIAAIPTLAVFVFFQNIIIKGIVVPMEK